MEDISVVKQRLDSFRLTPWDSLPDFDIYMDQLISFVRRQSGELLDEDTITSAMVNNYIKDGLMPRAAGKRYGREHIALLTAIYMLKNVLSVHDMSVLLENGLKTATGKEYYEQFREMIDDVMSAAAETVQWQMDGEDLPVTALRLAVMSCACKLACEQLLSLMDESPQEGKKKKKSAAAKARGAEQPAAGND